MWEIADRLDHTDLGAARSELWGAYQVSWLCLGLREDFWQHPGADEFAGRTKAEGITGERSRNRGQRLSAGMHRTDVLWVESLDGGGLPLGRAPAILAHRGRISLSGERRWQNEGIFMHCNVSRAILGE